MRGFIHTIKMALALSVIVLAIIATLYVLDVFTAEAARKVLVKIMSLVGIWAAASLVLLVISLLGSKNPK
jgi:hypothetical protein